MYSKTYTFFVNPSLITVECQVSRGLPSFNIIGLPSKSIQESKDRIKSALSFIGIDLPPKKITINLNPVDISKQGNHFDLPMAVSLLKALNLIKIKDNIIFAGELSLNAQILPVRSVINYLMEINGSEYELVLPSGNKQEVSVLKNYINFNVKFISHLSELFDFDKIKVFCDFDIFYEGESKDVNELIDLFESVRGQEFAKYALLVSSIGKHNVLMVGPPGTGKSILAKSSLCLYPKPSEEEFIEIARIYNLAGYEYDYWIKFKNVRPFRSPHHTSSYASVVGGSRDAKVGEITLAHKGILFLDEFPEFHRNVLEALREPLENKRITISRAEIKVEYPADFVLISAMNPCPCGYYQTNVKECTCTSFQISKYWSKISGPLLDRIDIFIEVSNVDFQQVISNRKSVINYYKELFLNAINTKEQRKQEKANSELSIEEINQYCLTLLTNEAKEIVEKIYNQQRLSIRKFHKILKVARTIADIKQSINIDKESLLNAYKLTINRYV